MYMYFEGIRTRIRIRKPSYDRDIYIFTAAKRHPRNRESSIVDIPLVEGQNIYYRHDE